MQVVWRKGIPTKTEHDFCRRVSSSDFGWGDGSKIGHKLLIFLRRVLVHWRCEACELLETCCCCCLFSSRGSIFFCLNKQLCHAVARSRSRSAMDYYSKLEIFFLGAFEGVKLFYTINGSFSTLSWKKKFSGPTLWCMTVAKLAALWDGMDEGVNQLTWKYGDELGRVEC